HMAGTRLLLRCGGSGELRLVDVRTGRTVPAPGLAVVRSRYDACELPPTCGFQVGAMGRRWVGLDFALGQPQVMIELATGREAFLRNTGDQRVDLDAAEPIKTLCPTFAGLSQAEGMAFADDFATAGYQNWVQRCGGRRRATAGCGVQTPRLPLLVVDDCSRDERRLAVVTMAATGRQRTFTVPVAPGGQIRFAVTRNRLFVTPEDGPVLVGRLPLGRR
ncbi:MAG TPA: hypothetical protein VN238_00730, partial [Solirubrobacteraceae bacterium]|nr:hypothetical protein [Solirubrobacteraceae bacterium]